MSDDRWSTSNLVMPISYEEFKSLTAAFNQAAARAFGTETKLEIKVLCENKITGGSYGSLMMNSAVRENEKNTIQKTDKPDGLTKDIWQKAAYVEVNVRPVDESKAPAYAWGQIQFKGYRPRQATFYIQGCLNDGDEQVKKEVLATRPRRSVTGNGYKSNTR